MKKITAQLLMAFNIIYVLIISVFLADLFDAVAIKGELLKLFFHQAALILTPVAFIINLASKIKKIQFIIICMTCITTISTFSYVIYRKGVLGYLFSTSSWNTQTIVYQNTAWKNKKIEFQMRDVGALGYNRRYVMVTYLTPWLMLTKTVDPNLNYGKQWKKVDKNVNELEIVW